MHMADALISPTVGGVMWAASAALIGYSARKVQQNFDDVKTPLMGALGAFIFAAQMINFTIPATGSSGHLGGGMILAILLGPHAAFLTMASILTIQAIFFADGGLLALGCNIFNLGFFPCFIVYPLIYRLIVGSTLTKGRIATGSMISSIIGLQLGAFSVVIETLFSRISELPFAQFVLLMQPIHLAIGIVEGMATSAVIIFIWQARPDLIEKTIPDSSLKNLSIKPVLIGLIIVSVLTGGILSWFASTHPDGLEWSMFKISGKEELESGNNNIYSFLANIQGKTAVLPDYTFKKSDKQTENSTETWPEVDQGTSFSGLIGGAAVFVIALAIGFGLRKKKTSK